MPGSRELPPVDLTITDPTLRGGLRGDFRLPSTTGETRSGCMMAAAVLGQSERVDEIRSYAAQGLSASSADLETRIGLFSPVEIGIGKIYADFSIASCSKPHLLSGILLAPRNYHRHSL